MLRKNTNRRSGAAAFEFAMISPVLMVLTFGLIVGGLGIFRYHQLAMLARETARKASVQGLDYQRETGNPAASPETLFNEVVMAQSVGLKPNDLSCTITWDDSNIPKRFTEDKEVITNVVTVTVTYNWLPELFFGGVTLSSTSKMPMSF